MFKKVDTKYLLIAFVVLLILTVFLLPEKNNRKNRSFKSEITNLDTSEISLISIYPKGNKPLVSLKKKGSDWKVSEGTKEFNADANHVRNILSTIQNLKAKRLAANNKDNWKKYEVTDSLATRVKLSSEKKELSDLYIGKFSYSQPPQSQNPYMQQQGTMTTYVRLGGEKEVYAVDGFLGMMFNREAKDFRNSKILNLDKTNISRINFTLPDQDFALMMNDSVWSLDGIQPDSTSMANYLSGLTYLNSNDYLDDEIPVGKPTHSVVIETKNNTGTVQVDAYYTDSTRIIISSSLNPDTYFDGTKADLFDKLFKQKNYFQNTGQ